ncbi:MAG: dienelactone hydrolase family protein [Chloroflexi bacterium]|nr:dienelactone hydrolase family protein [Chloroflexota bacterium]
MDRAYVMELVKSFQTGGMTRRQFTKRATVALGSVAMVNLLLTACQPISPSQTPAATTATGTITGTTATTSTATLTTTSTATTTITTDESGLTTGMVEYPGIDNQTLMGYQARPADDQPHPTIIVIQEWWGLNENIKDIARRFAKEGFVALAPDLYHGKVATEPNEAQKLVMELDMNAAVQEIQQAVAYLGQQDYVAPKKLGIVGFCMGGRLALMTGRVEQNLGAVVAFYGSPLTAQEAAELKAPVLGLYGDKDQSNPVDKVKAMQAALDKAGIQNEFQIYAGAPHAFFNDTQPSYNVAAATDAWPRTLAWFRDHLKS